MGAVGRLEEWWRGGQGLERRVGGEGLMEDGWRPWGRENELVRKKGLVDGDGG